MRAFFGPTSTQRRYVDVGREQFLKPRVAIAGNGADRRSLNEEYCAAPGKKGSYLAPLNSADFHLIGAYGKDGRASGLAKLGGVLGLPAENSPSDAGGCGSLGYLRKRGSADGFYKDSAGPKRRFRLDGLEELRALRDGIVVGINDLGLDTEFRRGGFRSCGLFHLIVVVLGYQRNQETKCRHPMPPPFKQSQSTGVEKERRIANPFPGGLASCTSMRRFRRLNRAGQQIPEVGTFRAAESKIHFAVEGIEPVVYGLCGNLGLKHFVLRTDFVLCFLDGLENARSEKRKNSGTEADHVASGNEHRPAQQVRIHLIPHIGFLRHTPGADNSADDDAGLLRAVQADARL